MDQRPKPFPCTICELRFESHDRLRGHLYNHRKSAARDAKCEFCEKTYTQAHTLKEHLMAVHKLSDPEARASIGMKTRCTPLILPGQEITQPSLIRPLKPSPTCGICSRKYSRRSYLTAHLVSAHGKSHEEAKKITGFKAKREMPAKTTSNRTGRKKKVTEITAEEETPSESSPSASADNVMFQISQPDDPAAHASTFMYNTLDMTHPCLNSVPIQIPQNSQGMGQWPVTNTYPFGFVP